MCSPFGAWNLIANARCFHEHIRFRGWKIITLSTWTCAGNEQTEAFLFFAKIHLLNHSTGSKFRTHPTTWPPPDLTVCATWPMRPMLPPPYTKSIFRFTCNITHIVSNTGPTHNDHPTSTYNRLNIPEHDTLRKETVSYDVQSLEHMSYQFATEVESLIAEHALLATAAPTEHAYLLEPLGRKHHLLRVRHHHHRYLLLQLNLGTHAATLPPSSNKRLLSHLIDRTLPSPPHQQRTVTESLPNRWAATELENTQHLNKLCNWFTDQLNKLQSWSTNELNLNPKSSQKRKLLPVIDHTTAMNWDDDDDNSAAGMKARLSTAEAPYIERLENSPSSGREGEEVVQEVVEERPGVGSVLPSPEAIESCSCFYAGVGRSWIAATGCRYYGSGGDLSLVYVLMFYFMGG